MWLICGSRDPDCAKAMAVGHGTGNEKAGERHSSITGHRIRVGNETRHRRLAAAKVPRRAFKARLSQLCQQDRAGAQRPGVRYKGAVLQLWRAKR
jgi:hypothetical protein